MNKGAKMSLSEQLKKDIVTAMKGKEEMRLSVLRMAKAALQLKEVEKMRPLDETESIQLLQTLVKQRKESIEQFAKGGRQDLVDKENAELKFLEAYLPAGASDGEMDASVAGKHVARVQQIFRSGTVIYNGYRYWWDALPADQEEIARLLIPFPDDDPSRPFEPETATAVLLEIGGGAQRSVVEIPRQNAVARQLFAKHSLWDVLTAFASGKTARYEKYSHARRADLFRISLPFDQAQQLLAAMLAAAPRKLKYRWSTLRAPAAVTFVCPRE